MSKGLNSAIIVPCTMLLSPSWNIKPITTTTSDEDISIVFANLLKTFEREAICITVNTTTSALNRPFMKVPFIVDSFFI